tara:strand:+ start:434 stop:544 length:111 start_codon:yes stop_codon:yes gene_type:complete
MTKGEKEFVPAAVTLPVKAPPELVTDILPVNVPLKL